MTKFRHSLSTVMSLVGFALPVLAQQTSNAPGAAGTTGPTAMIMLQVEHNKGRDFITTPKGFRAEVPGKGIASNAKVVAVYQDQGKNYWYIDKHGEPTAVKPEVVQSAMAQFQAEIQRNQAVSQAGVGQSVSGVPGQQTTIINNQGGTNNSGGGSAGMMGAAGMAMSGAALGMSIGALADSSHSYYGVPYGRSVYNDNHRYYYNNGNKKVYVAPNVNNKQYFNEFNRQGSWNNRNTWSHSAYPAAGYDRGIRRGFRR